MKLEDLLKESKSGVFMSSADNDDFSKIAVSGDIPVIIGNSKNKITREFDEHGLITDCELVDDLRKLQANNQRSYDFVMAFGRLFRDGMKPISARDEYVEAGQKLMKRFLDGEDPYPK